MTNLSKQFQVMTDTELNRKICEKLGICCHEPLFKGSKVCRLCGTYCDAESMSEFNPDFTVNSKVLLEAVKEKLGEERYVGFINKKNVGLVGLLTDYPIHVHMIAVYETYILNPRSLCEKFLEFMEDK